MTKWGSYAEAYKAICEKAEEIRAEICGEEAGGCPGVAWGRYEKAYEAIVDKLEEIRAAIPELGNGGFAQGFRAQPNAQQSIPNTTFTKLNFHVEDFDLANEFDLDTDQFVPSVDGYYFLCGHGTLIDLADGKKIILSIYKNGSRHAEGRSTVGGTDYVGVFVSDILYLTTEDIIELRLYHNQGYARNTTGNGVGVAFSAWRLY